jgi:hypothetical protein
MSSAVAQTRTDQASLHSAEPFEGFWAKTKEECLDEEAPNSRTMIDLSNIASGKPAPIFDQYENHCLIVGRNTSVNDTILSVTCYESWENFAKRIEGSEAKIKLTRSQKGRLIIDGISYQRCEARPTPSNATPNARPHAPGATIAAGPPKISETFEKDRVWEEQIKYGACTLLRDKRTDSAADVAECGRLHAQQPLCKSYSGFAYAWFDMANESNAQMNDLDLTRNIIDSLGTKTKNSDNDPDYYRSPEYRQLLHRLANVIFSPRRNEWKSKEELVKFAYKICMDGHPF